MESTKINTTFIKKRLIQARSINVSNLDKLKDFSNNNLFDNSVFYLAVAVSYLLKKNKNLFYKNLTRQLLTHSGLAVRYYNTTVFKGLSLTFNSAFYAIRHLRSIFLKKTAVDLPRKLTRRRFKRRMRRRFRMLRYRAQHLYSKRSSDGYHRSIFLTKRAYLKYFIPAITILSHLCASNKLVSTFVGKPRLKNNANIVL